MDILFFLAYILYRDISQIFHQSSSRLVAVSSVSGCWIAYPTMYFNCSSSRGSREYSMFIVIG